MPDCLVDAARRPAPRRNCRAQRHHLLEALLAVLEVDRVDDRLALAVGERHRRCTFSSVESIISGHAHLLDHHARGSASMSSSSSRSGLARQTSMIWAPRFTWAPGDLRGVLELLGDDQLLELAAADDVGALADDDRAHVVGRPRGSRRRDSARARRGRRPCAASRPRDRLGDAPRMCAGVVPQQPPTTFSQPSSTKRRSERASISGVSR